MDREANYVAVGAFVLLVLALGTTFVIWYAGRTDGQPERRYETYFEGSVAGLSEGSSVRYLGVAVGRVAKIQIDPRDAGRVRVVADIAAATPIGKDTVARLTLQGVTGLLYVDLRPRDPGTRPRPPIESLQYSVIPSEQSEFGALVSSLPDVVAKAGESLDRINLLLSDHNIASTSAAVRYTERATSALPIAIDEARAMFLELRAAAQELRATSTALHKWTNSSGSEISTAATELRKATEMIATTTSRLDRLVAENEGNIDRFAEQGLAEFEQLVRETREAMRSIDLLTDSLQRDPSRLVYRPPPAGVEIPQ